MNREEIKPGKHVIGITGGVGSGKSTVLELLARDYDAVIIQADLVSKELMEPGRASYQAVIRDFGTGILAEDGTIDRQKLAEIVFSDEEKLLHLNAMTHPLVEQEMERRIADAEGLVVLEAALPKEAAFDRLCDETWYIHVPEEIRISRLMVSRGYSREKCLQIMANQLPEGEFRALSQVVIENGGAEEETKAAIRQILNRYQGFGTRESVPDTRPGLRDKRDILV